MSGRKEDVDETPQQRAMVQIALNKVQDYKQRWLPLQKQLASHIADIAKPGSAARKAAEGVASTSTEQQFAGARTGLEGRLASTGGLGSSKAKLAIAGMGEDEATAQGLGIANADQQVDDAYVSGLNSIMALGQGQQAGAIKGTSEIAARSGRQAQADAEESLANRMGNVQLASQFAGMGLGLAKPGTGGVDGLQAKFSNTDLGRTGFGTGLAYGNEDMALNF